MPQTAAVRITQSQDLLDLFQERLQYHFKDPEILRRGLTHPSSTAEENDDNERMEFLGDAILGLCVGQLLYEKYPDRNEGELTRIKSAVVSTVSLARVGEVLELRKYARLGKGLPANEPLPASVYANLFEAVCAAVYLDGGLPAARALVRKFLFAEMVAVAENGRDPNHKSTLQQFAQKHTGLTPQYHVVRCSGPDHGKIFEISAVIGKRCFPCGHGRSKKSAEQAAARRALEVLEAEQAFAAAMQASNGNGCNNGNGNGHLQSLTSGSTRVFLKPSALQTPPPQA